MGTNKILKYEDDIYVVLCVFNVGKWACVHCTSIMYTELCTLYKFYVYYVHGAVYTVQVLRVLCTQSCVHCTSSTCIMYIVHGAFKSKT